MREERVSKFVLSGCPFFLLFPSTFSFFFPLEGKKRKYERGARERKRETALAGATKKRIRDVIVSTIATNIRRHES